MKKSLSLFLALMMTVMTFSFTASAYTASDWAKDSVYFMSSKSIINGVGENKFAPKNNASREQAIIIATRMTGIEIILAEGIKDIDPYDEEREKPEVNNKKDTYTIGFIGGSLTEGGAAWIKETKDFLAEKMPDKEIVTINAGKGGTRSNYGTARFMEDIGQYAPDMEEKGYETFTDYLATMYNKSGSGFDVHGGYEKYADAIIEAFTEDYAGCTAQIKDASLVNGTKRNLVEAKYTYIYTNSARLNYSGNWKTYTDNAQVPTNDSAVAIGAKQFAYPYFPAAIKQIVNEQAAVGFMSKAKAICINFPGSAKGSKATVYVDNEVAGTLSANSTQNVNVISGWVSLPSDGQEHKVIIVVDAPTTDAYVFRFGAIIERS